MNPLFQQTNNNSKNQLLQNFKQFAQTTSPQFAEQKVKELLQTGQMSESDYNKISNVAKDFMNAFNIK